jgi:hypothetical protein
MRKALLGAAAAALLATLALPGTASAAQKLDPGIHKQTAGEEFSSQRRYYRRHYYPRRYYVRRYWPRYYGYYGWAPRYYGWYGAGYPYYPYAGIGFGPFGIWW